MLVISPIAAPVGSEKTVLNTLKNMPGIAITGVYIGSGQRGGERESDIILITPERVAIIEVKGAKPGFSGQVATPQNDQWTVGGKTGAFYGSPGRNPYVQVKQSAQRFAGEARNLRNYRSAEMIVALLGARGKNERPITLPNTAVPVGDGWVCLGANLPQALSELKSKKVSFEYVVDILKKIIKLETSMPSDEAIKAEGFIEIGVETARSMQPVRSSTQSSTTTRKPSLLSQVHGGFTQGTKSAQFKSLSELRSPSPRPKTEEELLREKELQERIQAREDLRRNNPEEYERLVKQEELEWEREVQLNREQTLRRKEMESLNEFSWFAKMNRVVALDKVKNFVYMIPLLAYVFLISAGFAENGAGAGFGNLAVLLLPYLGIQLIWILLAHGFFAALKKKEFFSDKYKDCAYPEDVVLKVTGRKAIINFSVAVVFILPILAYLAAVRMLTSDSSDTSTLEAGIAMAFPLGVIAKSWFAMISHVYTYFWNPEPIRIRKLKADEVAATDKFAISRHAAENEGYAAKRRVRVS